MKFSCQRWICLTADIWSCKNKSFLAINGHFLDEKTLKRKSYVLSCEYFSIPHNYETITERFQLLYSKYGINSSSIVSTITDSGSNFVKAFNVFGQNTHKPDEETDNNAEIGASSSQSTSNSSQEDEIEFLMELLNKAESGNEIDTNGDSLLDSYQSRIECVGINDDEALALSNHDRCLAHQLNLTGSVDSLQANKHNKTYEKLYDGVFDKLETLWNCCGRQGTSETILKYLGRNITRPGKTRWNSTFDKVI